MVITIIAIIISFVMLAANDAGAAGGGARHPGSDLETRGGVELADRRPHAEPSDTELGTRVHGDGVEQHAGRDDCAIALLKNGGLNSRASYHGQRRRLPGTTT